MIIFSAKNIKAAAALTGGVAAIVLVAYYGAGHHGSFGNYPKRTIELTYRLTITGIPQEAKHVQVWVPLPLSNSHQKLLDFQVCDDWPYMVIKGREYGNRFLLFELTDTALSGARQVALSIKFHVTRHAIRPLQDQPLAQAGAAGALGRYLTADRLIPIDGKIAQEARRIAGHAEKPLPQARLLYEHIVSTLTYDNTGTGWGRGDAVYACDIRRGNCTDFHSLFIGEARALNIPARFIIIMGLPLPQEKADGVIPGYHCWGEFYIPEKGWLPIDAAEANKFPEKKEMFFAALDEHRVAFSIGRDIKLPRSAAEPINYAIYPHVEIDGRAHKDVKTTFSFKDYLLTDGARTKLVTNFDWQKNGLSDKSKKQWYCLQAFSKPIS